MLDGNAALADANTPADLSPTDALDAALDADFDSVIGDTQDEQDEAASPSADTQDTQDPAEAATDPQVATDDDPAAQDTDVEAKTDADDPDTGTPDAPALWDAKGRDLFKTATPELQAYLTQREKALQGEHTRRQQEMAKLRLDLHTAQTQPDTELQSLITRQRSRVESYAGATDEALLHAVTTGRITGEQAAQLRQARDAEKSALQELENAESQREAQRHSDHQKTEFLKLQSTAPELATREGLSAVNEFLFSRGRTPEDIKWITADDYVLADAARQWFALQDATSKSKPAPVKTGKATPAKPSNTGNPRAAKMAALRRQNTPQALAQLLEMQLEDDAAEMGF